MPSKGAEDTSFLTSKGPSTDAIMKQKLKEIDSPIPFITPLQYSKENLNAWIICKEYLTPISMEELPSNELFFSNKRNVVVK
jgi:hypothetical protein